MRIPMRRKLARGALALALIGGAAGVATGALTSGR